MPDFNALFRAIPSVDKCLEILTEGPVPAKKSSRETGTHALHNAPRSLLRDAVTSFWDARRSAIKSGAVSDPSELSLEQNMDALTDWCLTKTAPHMQKVINATGVVIHTNTGRSRLARAAVEAMTMAAAGNSTLEFSRETGGRGSRHEILADVLRNLTGAEDGIAVNNNAAAVLLALDTFCKGGEVIISRGELVEIGGSFRIPDVMQSTGAVLREVGTTNRTHPEDYERAITDNTRAIIRVHTSNYRIIGFHSAVPTDELADLAHRHNLPLFNDLGSGSILDVSPAGLPAEPTVPESIRLGSDLVLFSGDKLLGGPQAGIIAGRSDLLAKIRKNPLLRALRLDKTAYAALEATLRLYYEPDRARKEIPTLAAILEEPRSLARKARTLKARLSRELGDRCTITLARDSSRVGGGAFPECSLPTTLVVLQPSGMSAAELKKRLLATTPVVIGRLENDAFCLDPRTIDPQDFAILAGLLHKALL